MKTRDFHDFINGSPRLAANGNYAYMGGRALGYKKQDFYLLVLRVPFIERLDGGLIVATFLQSVLHALDAGIQGMQHTLQESGYYKATIKPFYEWDSQNQQVKVLFFVTQGSPAHIGVITVSGKPGTTIDEVMEIARLHPGDRVTSAHLTRALQKLRRHFQREDRLEAQVTLTQRDYHPESNTLDYTFAI